MLVITQNSEALIKEEIDFLCKGQVQMRCILVRLSESTTKRAQWFLPMAELIRRLVGDSEGKIFKCDNDDLFITTPNVTQKSFGYLVQALSQLAPDIKTTGLAHLFELPVARDEILSTLYPPEAENTAIEIELRNTAVARPIKIDPKELLIRKDLLSTLQERRAKRSHPLILVVEDDPFSQRLVCKSLEENFEVIAAHDGREAITQYLRKAPDMVFLDIGLPDSSGLDLLLNLIDFDAQAYIVMLSGNGNRPNIVKAVENGAKGFVGKPFTRDKLLNYALRCPSITEKGKTLLPVT